MSDKLKPCPFCGGEGSHWEWSDTYGCLDCGAERDTLDAWNQRDSGLVEALELVKVALELEKVFKEIHQNHWPIVALTAINNLFIPAMEYREALAKHKGQT